MSAFSRDTSTLDPELLQRRARFYIPVADMLNKLLGWGPCDMPELPADVGVTAVYFDEQRNAFGFIVRSASFDVVPEAEMAPELPCVSSKFAEYASKWKDEPVDLPALAQKLSAELEEKGLVVPARVPLTGAGPPLIPPVDHVSTGTFPVNRQTEGKQETWLDRPPLA